MIAFLELTSISGETFMLSVGHITSVYPATDPAQAIIYTDTAQYLVQGSYKDLRQMLSKLP